MMRGLEKIKARHTSHCESGVRTAQRPLQSQARESSSRVGVGSTDGGRPIQRHQVEAIAAQINDTLRQMEERFSVSVDDASGMVVVRITDTATGELVKQIPPQQILDASVSVKQIVGLLFDRQA